MNILLALLFFALSTPEVEKELVSGDTVYVDEAPIDFITQQPTMELRGFITSDVPLIEVDVTRVSSGLSDQLCIGSCVNGNGEEAQHFEFRVNAEQQYDWYAHFMPMTAGKYPITYTFTAGEEIFTVTAVYRYTSTGIEKTHYEAVPQARKIVRDGQVLIETKEHRYTLLGL